jgi:hypothetical protein
MINDHEGGEAIGFRGGGTFKKISNAITGIFLG